MRRSEEGDLLEEGEVDAAVGAVGNEMRMGREILRLTVLEDKESVGSEERGVEMRVGGWKLL